MEPCVYFRKCTNRLGYHFVVTRSLPIGAETLQVVLKNIPRHDKILQNQKTPSTKPPKLGYGFIYGEGPLKQAQSRLGENHFTRNPKPSPSLLRTITYFL
ncbi:hypothetical protein V6Z11_A09G084600 [Gossypium hirsutum]